MYVTPKADCPHVVDKERFIKLEDFQKIDFASKICQKCEEKCENWICLTCGDFYCSRYVNSHMVAHYSEDPTHNVCISMMDLSFWCYDCDCYIVDRNLNKYYRIVSDAKFGKNFIPTLDDVTNAMEHLKIDSKKIADIKYQNFVEMLKNGVFKKISFMTGAGISTTAGIPDFRSSDSGLFKVLQEKYFLSSPEEFFQINTFKSKPELFYEFAKEFDLEKYDPTITHWFMSFLHHKGLLHMIFTQNIDSLEIKAKVPKEKLVHAHGNFLEAHCSECKKEHECALLKTHINEGKVLYCEDCKGPVKPKIIFYGEALPQDFFMKQDEFKQTDLGFVMGTSLKVMPFNYLPYQLDKNTWRIVVNRERVGHENGNSGFRYDDVSSLDMFLEGTTDEKIIKLIEDCGWKEEFDEYVKNNK